MPDHSTIPVSAEAAHQQAEALRDAADEQSRPGARKAIDAAAGSLNAAVPATDPAGGVDLAALVDDERVRRLVAGLIDQAWRAGVSGEIGDVAERVDAFSRGVRALTATGRPPAPRDQDRVEIGMYGLTRCLVAAADPHNYSHPGEVERGDHDDDPWSEVRSLIATHDRLVDEGLARELGINVEQYADDYLPIGERIAELIETARLVAAPASEAATEGGEPWLPMPVERAIERLDRSTAADTISEHRHAIITLQNFARHALAATPREQGTAEAATEGASAVWTAGPIVRVQDALERVLDEHDVGRDVNADALYALTLTAIDEVTLAATPREQP